MCPSQLLMMTAIQNGQDLSIHQFRKKFDRAHHYATSVKLRILETTAENAMWEYYKYLDEKLIKLMNIVSKEYKNQLLTEFIREKLWYPEKSND